MRLTNLLLCLDLSSIDTVVVESAVQLQQKSKSLEKVVLLHNVRYDFIQGYLELDQEGIVTLKKQIEKKLSDKFYPLLSRKGLTCEILIKDENSTEKAILRVSKEHHIDLMLMGKKDETNGSGVIPQKILSIDEEKTPILLVPEGKKPQFHHLLAAVDLSPSSAQVVEGTLNLANSISAKSVACLHVYKLPLTYFPYIKHSDTQLKERIQQRAKNKFDGFIKSIELEEPGLKALQLKSGGDVVGAIHDYAIGHDHDLIAIMRISKFNLLGNKLGGVTRRFLTQKSKKALLII